MTYIWKRYIPGKISENENSLIHRGDQTVVFKL